MGMVEQYPSNANLLVLVLDFETLDCEEAVATDFSSAGCRILSDKIQEMGKPVGLRLSGLDKMIRGRVSDVVENGAVVCFEFKETTGEKRKEKRRSVSINAKVSSAASAQPVPCKIVDASLSGCRLAGEGVCDLPHDILLTIPGMDLPVKGLIVWQANGFAGVRLKWQFSGKKDYMKVETIRPPSLADKVRPTKTQRSVASAGPSRPRANALRP